MSKFAIGNVTVDTTTHKTYVRGMFAKLGPQQQRLLEILAQANGQPVSIETLQMLMGELPRKLVTVHVCNARKKLASLDGDFSPLESLEGAYVLREANAFRPTLEKRPRFSVEREDSHEALIQALGAIAKAPAFASYADVQAVELASQAFKLAAQWVKDTRELSRIPLAVAIATLQARVTANPTSQANLALAALAEGLSNLMACKYGNAKRFAMLARQSVA